MSVLVLLDLVLKSDTAESAGCGDHFELDKSDQFSLNIFEPSGVFMKDGGGCNSVIPDLRTERHGPTLASVGYLGEQALADSWDQTFINL